MSSGRTLMFSNRRWGEKVTNVTSKLLAALGEGGLGPGGAGDAGGGRGVSGPGGGYVLVSDFMHRVSRATFHKASVRTLVVHLLVELS